MTSMLNVGDTVVIRDLENEDEYKILQDKYFQWNDNMKHLLSSPCQVVEIEGSKVKVKTKTDDLLEVNIKILKVIQHVIFKEGEMVQVIKEEFKFKENQKGYGGWHDIMKMLLGKEVLVVKVISSSIRKIQFLSMEFNVNASCLVKLAKFAIGHQVRVIDCEERVKQFQIGICEWNDGMKMFLGKTGIVLDICNNDDVIVSFGFFMVLRFNPACLETEQDVLKRQEMESFINAIENGNEIVINKMANSNNINQSCPRTQMSPLMIAAKSHQDSNIFQLLINNGADINAHYDNGNTLLHFLVINEFDKHFDTVFEHKTDVNIINDSKMTALMIACKMGHEISFIKLINHENIDINLQDDKGNTALHHAIINSPDSIILSLIDKGSSLTQENQSSFSPFHLLAVRQNIKVIETILIAENKSLVDIQKSNDKFTSLHICALHGYVEMMRFLLDSGADINLRNSDGETALHIAVLRDYDCVELLCRVLCNVNAQDNIGNTALHKLVKRIPDKELESVAKIAECLLRSGANVNLCNNQGFTAIEICDHSYIKKILLNNTGICDLQKSNEESLSDCQELKDKISTIETEDLCQICLDCRKDLIFNCGHRCCRICGTRLQSCHICRCDITDRIIIQIN